MRYPLFAKNLLSHAEYAKLLVGKGFDFVLGKFGAVAAQDMCGVYELELDRVKQRSVLFGQFLEWVFHN